MDTFNFKFRTLILALTGVLFLSIGDAYSMGSVYSDGRAFLRPGSPSGAGKVYVGKSDSEINMATPSASSYKACNSSTSPAMTQQVKGTEKKTWYHFFALANPGYKFLGWYDPDDKPLTMYDASRGYYRGWVQSGTMALSGDLHAYLDCYACFIKCIQMSFVTPTNGSFTIENNGAFVANYATFTVDGKVVLTAAPANGYKLRGWYTTTDGGITKSYVSFGTTYEPTGFTTDVTIGAEFVPDDGKATFWIKGTNQLYGDLNQANTAAANSSSKMIVVVSDGTVGEGTYTISSNVTLLIPFKDTYDKMDAPRVIKTPNSSATYKKTTTFRKLSLAKNAVINCEGQIQVGGTLASVPGGSASSFPTGTVGMIDMSRGGTINLKSGSHLRCWGFVKGQDMDQGNNTKDCGQIIAESGSHVWEFFQVGDWRGGNNCLTIYNNKSWRYFPFQAWSIQNVEVPVTYNSGAKNHCYWSIFGNGEINTINFVSISDAGGAGVFQISSGATVKKWYDPTTDRVCVELGGSSTLDAITLDILGETVTSADYNLPLPANIRLILKNGSNSSISKPVVAHAGSVIDVQEGGKLTISGTLYLFDHDEWDKYCMGKYFCTYESPSIHFNRGDGSANTALEDATIIVDGDVSVTGNMYATAGGANICGNNGGTIKYSKLPGNGTMTQCKEYVKNVSVAVRSANLHNENGTYTKGSVATYKNVNGRWFLSTKSTPKSNKTYDFTYIKSGDVYGTGGTNATVSACYSKDKTSLEICDKWVNIKADDCDDWWVGIDDGHKYNYFESNAWHQFIKTTMTVGEGEGAMTIYSGSNGKLYAMNEDCDIEDFGDIDANCQYTLDGVKKVLIGNSFVSVVKNTEDEAYHKSDAASTYYICFEGCVWKPATKVAGKENAYTVESVPYIWYNGAWLPVTWDGTVGLYYSLDASNVQVYYEYVDGAWVLATPVAEVITSSTTEQVYSLGNAVTKAGLGGTNVTIRLLKHVSGTINYTASNNCSLDLNGFTLSSTTTNMIKVNNASANFIIKDQSAAGTGKILAQYSRSDDFVYGLNVTSGHLILNSGTVQIENTHATKGACGVYISSGTKFTMNGGKLEVTSKCVPRGIWIAGSTTSEVYLNGGTIETSATDASYVGTPYGIYGEGGTIYMVGGAINTSNSSTGNYSATVAASGIALKAANSKLQLTGGSVTATATQTAYGVSVESGATATVSGGTVTAQTTTGAGASAVYSAATTTISGGTLQANAYGANGYGVHVAGGTTIVEGGSFDVQADNTACGVYATAGTLTVSEGTFAVTTKGNNAYAAYVPSTGTPTCTVKGGAYMLKNSNGSGTDKAFANNTDAPSGKLVMKGGYYNIIPATTHIPTPEYTVRTLISPIEQSYIDAGYIRKIAGTERTVTWKNYDGSTLNTTLVEMGQRPQWTGATPTYTSADNTYLFDGWCTGDHNGGTYHSGALPEVTGDVTYFAHYKTYVAEVTINGITTPYNTVSEAWAAAMGSGHTQALIRLLAKVDNVGQLVFTPAESNAIITMDLNGFSWTIDASAATSQKGKAIYINKDGCKLIITDNSASHNGYLLCKWAHNGTLIGVHVAHGALELRNGGLRAQNTYSGQYCEAVRVNGKFMMTGGEIYATDAQSPRALNVPSDGKADITGGTIHAHAINNNAYALLPYGVINVGGDAIIKATAANTGAYAAQSLNGTLNVDGGTYIAVAASTAQCFRARGTAKITIDGNPTVRDTTKTGNDAFALCAAEGACRIDVNSGDFIVKGATAKTYGAYAISGTLNVNGGTFTVKASEGKAIRAVGGTTNVTGTPEFDAYYGVDVADEAVSSGSVTATVNIDGGIFNTTGWAVRSLTTTGSNTVTGDVTIWDGKFHATGNCVTATAPDNLKIRGGWYTNNAGGKIDTGSGNYVVSPSWVKTLTAADQPEYGEGYQYQVLTKFSVTWSVNGETSTQEYERNEIPTYEGPTPSKSDGYNTWEFTGWSPEVGPVTGDVVYTAQFTKYEAEVYEGESTTPIRYANFIDAWNKAKNLPIAKIKLLSDVSRTAQLELKPDSANGSRPLTLDLNNRKLSYTGTASIFLTVNKADIKLIVTDTSGGTRGEINGTVNRNGLFYVVAVNTTGELQLDGGRIFAKNTYTGQSAVGVTPCHTSTFTMTGGTIEAEAPRAARAVRDNQTPTVRISGGELIAKSFSAVNGADTTWSHAAYALHVFGTLEVTGTPKITVSALDTAYGVYTAAATAKVDIAGGTFSSTIHGGYESSAVCAAKTKDVKISNGTFNAYSRDAGENVHALDAREAAKVEISGGTFLSKGYNRYSHGIYVEDATVNISGGTFTGDSYTSNAGHVEALRMHAGAVCTISGGTFESKQNGSAVRCLAGTLTIGGGTFTSTVTYTIGVAEYALNGAGAVEATINGGTFICTGSNRNLNVGFQSGKTTSVTTVVNGGYFYNPNHNQIASVTSGASLVLYGGKYNEKGTTTNHHDNIDGLKGPNTGIVNINETVDGRTYKYHLATMYTVTWIGGDSYSKVVPDVSSGTIPENHDLDGTYFLRNDSAFYFSGWDPTPAPVTGDISYHALGDHWAAKVTVGVKDSLFADFDEAWAYAMNNQEATVTLLSPITRTDIINYRPSDNDARHILDLNDFTITNNVSDRLLVISKKDGQLTIMDNSTQKRGSLYKKSNSSSTTQVCTVNAGELVMEGGTIYTENTLDNADWHPAMAVNISQSADAKFTMTGGIVESKAIHHAFPIYNDGIVHISGGNIIANATSSKAYGIHTIDGTATITGSPVFTVSAATEAYGVSSNGWTKPDATQAHNSVTNVQGGIFNVSASQKKAYGIFVQGRGTKVGETIAKANGVVNVSGGTFNVTCSATSATEILAVQCTGWRLFDEATPHHMLAESLGEVNISGGTFMVDTRNAGAWVQNAGGVDLVRNWGTINISSGTFTIYQKRSATGIACYRNKVTVSGSPVFNIHCDTYARGIVPAASNNSSYCDADASKNLAEIEVSGGTFNVTATDSLVVGAQANGEVADGYPMSSKITITGGEFICTAPKSVRMFRQYANNVGAYGTATRAVIVKGGKFKPQIGTVAADGTVTSVTGTGANIETANPDKLTLKLTNLSGGYFTNDHRLENDKADTCIIVPITSAAVDPEFNNGYRFRIDVIKGAELDIVDVDNENHTMTINVSNWSAWPYTINGTEYNQGSGALANDLTLTIPYTGNPGEEVEIAVADNTTTTVSQHTYIIPMEVTSATELLEDKLMSIYVNGTTLTINGDVRTLNVYVGADAAIVIKDGKTLDADSLFLRTKATMSAELKRLGSGNVAGRTKVFYTRIVSNNSDYYQFGLPAGCTVHTEDVKLSNGDNSKYYTGSGWILREYNEVTRAENGPDGPSGIGNWRSVQTNAYIAGGRGYNMYSALRCYREYYFPILLSDLDNKVPVAYTATGDEQNRGWNVLVSPLTETYTNTPVPEGIVIAWLSEGGTVQAQPTAIPPATAFVYQASSSGYLSFAGSTIVKNMPRRIKAEEEETRIQWVHLDIADANGVGDQTSVYSHPERYEETYQNGIDVLKYALTSSHATMYTLLPYGEMAFAGVADKVLEQGVPLTVYSPSAQELTISMRDNEWLNRLEYVYLIDNETGLHTDLFTQDYTFDAEAGTTEGRFLIQGVFKAPQGTTDIENGEAGDGEQVRKLLIRDKMYIVVNGRLYDATGKLVNK